MQLKQNSTFAVNDRLENAKQKIFDSILYQKFLIKFKKKFLLMLFQSIKNPRWALMFYLSRIHVIRSLVIFLNKHPCQQVYLEEESLFKDLDVDEAVESLKNDSLYLGIYLPQPILQEILDFSNSAIYHSDSDPRLPFRLHEKKQVEQKYKQNFVSGQNFAPASQCPAIKKLENDPKLWKIAAKYLETTPVFSESRLRWTFAVKDKISKPLKGVFNFHYDLEDYRFIKFMFYLFDVNTASGPHVCVKGSHKKKKLQHQLSFIRRRKDQEIIDYYGQEKIETICGKAGFGFVEDFYCFHKATIPDSQERLILEIKFSMNDYGKGITIR